MTDKKFSSTLSGKEILLQGYNQQKLKMASVLDKLVKTLFPKRHTVNMPVSFKNILVVQSHLIGDLIMATPLLKALRGKYPRAKITLLANNFSKELLKGAWYVDEIVEMKFPWSSYDYSWNNLKKIGSTVYRLRRHKYDLAIDAQIDMRNAFLMLLIGAERRLGYADTGGQSFLTDVPEFPAEISNLLEARLSVLKYLAIDCDDKSTNIPINDESLSYVQSFIVDKNIDSGKIIGIHPGASKKKKLWPAANYTAVVEYLEKNGFSVVLIEGPKEKEIIENIQNKITHPLIIFNSSLQNLIAFISKCRLLICLDSSAVHIASAVGTPTLALYGPERPDLAKPLVPETEIIWNEGLKCRPCEADNCIYDENICMVSITPEAVIRRLESKVPASIQ